ncbi:uncharacterized protein EV422DRAFT_367094 [Fimicolochytrium jonesii]|uniref:uncharacterized protein n=1 Tax=Fimicolochytrium jonesii TaxID=1396493 RepID=UPI0022FE6FFA|nr:uncharacterized protein EV422DRAFT_367094 [Fimicolochytrium jonesii]KAI8823714.1 hypothetical protein EV422DRAFT_367094 [Fimicolochytrium jonesii]
MGDTRPDPRVAEEVPLTQGSDTPRLPQRHHGAVDVTEALISDEQRLSKRVKQEPSADETDFPSPTGLETASDARIKEELLPSGEQFSNNSQVKREAPKHELEMDWRSFPLVFWKPITRARVLLSSAMNRMPYMQPQSAPFHSRSQHGGTATSLPRTWEEYQKSALPTPLPHHIPNRLLTKTQSRPESMAGITKIVETPLMAPRTPGSGALFQSQQDPLAATRGPATQGGVPFH